MPRTTTAVTKILKLQCLPKKAILRIMTHLQTPIPGIKPCPHLFIRPAFALAQTCRQFYELYRAKVLLLASVGSRNILLSQSCNSSCLPSLLPGTKSIAVRGHGPFAALFHTALTIEKPCYMTPLTNQNTSMDHNRAPEVYRSDAALWEMQLLDLFRAGKYVPGLRRVQMLECPMILGTELWCVVAENWHACLQELLIEDSYAVFEESSLAHIACLSELTVLQISSQAIHCIDPLANLTQLKELNLKSCLIEDDTFLPVLRNLKHLRKLDVSDTLITPFVMRCLPHSLAVLLAGEQNIYHREGQRPLSSCTCFLELGAQDAHIEICEHSGINTAVSSRMELKNAAFLNAEQLPMLGELQWGRWGSLAQGMTSLVLVLPILKCLSLYGPDFDDDVGQLLFLTKTLSNLELIGCRVTNNSAFLIGGVPTLISVTIYNCPSVTEEGQFGIADGLASRRGVLQSVKFSINGPSVTPARFKDEFLRMYEHHMTSPGSKSLRRD